MEGRQLGLMVRKEVEKGEAGHAFSMQGGLQGRRMGHLMLVYHFRHCLNLLNWLSIVPIVKT